MNQLPQLLFNGMVVVGLQVPAGRTEQFVSGEHLLSAKVKVMVEGAKKPLTVSSLNDPSFSWRGDMDWYARQAALRDLCEKGRYVGKTLKGGLDR